MLRLAVVEYRVAPHLLTLRQDIAPARHLIALLGLVVGALVGRKVVAVDVPYLAAGEETRRFGRDVVDDRVALHVVVGAVHLHRLDAHHVVRVGIVVAALRLDDVVVVQHDAAARIAADLLRSVEAEVVGVEQRVAVDHLDDGCIYLRKGVHTVIDGAVAVDVYRILIDHDAPEKAHLRIAVAHGAVADDNRAVVVRGEVAREADDAVLAVVVRAHVVGHEVDLARLRPPRRVLLPCRSTRPGCGTLLGHGLRRGSRTAIRGRLRDKQPRKEAHNTYDR